ncbi:mitochondrial uncoupling protein 4 isoform X2 [Hemicordylus capensis]|uniref:mitochondrial uncoupling protein 4 isoform X2 n=1 Tax=Hemicordylus capensis TaxID=884348 RepID=UPI0023038A41|nr:mitochondrial uncoupling protein 4 isoform X2 [Hemicordylus capensis]
MFSKKEEGSVSLSERWPRASKFILSACAASVAELVTFPLDLTKTRLQIQGESAVHRYGEAAKRTIPYRGMLRTAVGIIQEEGMLKLWQGATPAVYRHIVYSGVRMITYEHLRDSVLGRAEDKSFPLWKAVVGAMTAGAIGQFFASPTDLVKVQMQMEGKRRLEGKPLRFRGVHHAFLKILSEGGIWGLWAGWVPNVQRAALVNMGDLTTYDSVKHFLLLNTSFQDNMITHSIARGLLYKSSTDCLCQAIQSEGFMSLYKGFVPTWMRMAPWSLVFWLTYEQIRRISGISSF